MVTLWLLGSGLVCVRMGEGASDSLTSHPWEPLNQQTVFGMSFVHLYIDQLVHLANTFELFSAHLTKARRSCRAR